MPGRKKIKIATAGSLGKWIVCALGFTLRIRPYGENDLARHRGDDATDPWKGKPLLFALWHGPHFPGLYYSRNHGVYVITSQSADGEILTRILNSFGYQTVRGSSTRGGTGALIDLARKVEEGSDAAIAVDGPKGPRYTVKPGIILLAKMTGRPIVPVAGGLRRYYEVSSWDRYRIPCPFTRGIVIYGHPLAVPADASDLLIEEKRRELEEVLLHMQEEADALADQQ